ncbi:MAG: iron chaperone [Candidatus Limnocylindria bacterium]
MADTTKTTTRGSSSKGWTDAERAAMKERATELKKEKGRGKAKKADGLADLLAKVAEMPNSDRVMAERIHAIVNEVAPDLAPRTWYGMPAYANQDGKVICFFTPASKFKERFASFGFNADANLDEGSMWPTAWALTKLTAADEKKIAELVKKAVS